MVLWEKRGIIFDSNRLICGGYTRTEVRSPLAGRGLLGSGHHVGDHVAGHAKDHLRNRVGDHARSHVGSHVRGGAPGGVGRESR